MKPLIEYSADDKVSEVPEQIETDPVEIASTPEYFSTASVPEKDTYTVQSPIQCQSVLQVCDDVFINTAPNETQNSDPETDTPSPQSPKLNIDSKEYLPLPIDGQKSSVGDSDNESFERPYTDDDIDDITDDGNLDSIVDNSSKHDFEQVENSDNLSTDNCADMGAGNIN